MKIKELIHEIFDEYPTTVTLIPTGLTNNNYKVCLQDKTVVLRVPKPDNASLFDYAHEEKVLSLIQPLDLDTPLVYYNKQTGVKCSTYIPNAQTFRENFTKRATLLIKKLHSLNKQSGKTFQIRDMINLYKSQCTHPMYDLSMYDTYVDTLKQENLTLCHNDCVEGNFLFTDTKDYLIDFEYAMDNDPLFDIMSFITENDIQDPSLRNLIYETYFDEPISLELRHKLNHFEIVHHILWCTWAMMMCEKDDNDIFLTIRDLKYKRLLEAVERDRTL
ncbi:hypothetical protein AOC36_05600 [Erysipelothrix larvae]|uniref:Aminoglycoside phosphotransferase domain-containing protein n=1 Tax=Erysipelothrix larvae TaxID=1514105 RepID=A0A0X8GZW4_9FIRM|nr:choline kinase family protein [Erysipelothrix larvae]AMC93471.1 hypothetical protein AOC36_05600 [Erysipelothrix larvae]